MSPTQKKKDTVKELTQKTQEAHAIIFTEFRSISTQQMESLKRKVEEYNALYSVTKNTLMNIASQKADLGTLDDAITTGPIATLFCLNEPIQPIKILVEYSKEHDTITIKGGFLEKRKLSAAHIKELAELPPREELLTRVASSIQSPSRNLVYVLQANIQGLVNIIEHVRKHKNT